jgi:hypothetical protein
MIRISKFSFLDYTNKFPFWELIWVWSFSEASLGSFEGTSSAASSTLLRKLQERQAQEFAEAEVEQQCKRSQLLAKSL